MSPIAVAVWALLGAAGGIASWRIAEAVLAARDDAPGPGPTWGAVAAAVVGAGLFPVAAAVAGDPWLVPPFVGFAALTLTLT
ncbi:MAG: hypothetical protein M3349_06895, partial [Actinomycetota bacterium]|nr:hypothetical protein [Actinomycetota bacterium]